MGSISQFGGLDGCWACRRRWRRREGLADDEGEFAGRAGRLKLVDELLASRPHQKVRLNARLLRFQDDDVVPKLHLHPLSADYCSRDNIWELDHRCVVRSEEHTSELQSPCNLVCPLLLEKKKKRVPKGAQLKSCSEQTRTDVPARACQWPALRRHDVTGDAVRLVLVVFCFFFF